MENGPRMLGAGALGIALGLLVAGLWPRDPAAPGPPAPAAAETRDLEAALREARDDRLALEVEVARLKRELDARAQQQPVPGTQPVRENGEKGENAAPETPAEPARFDRAALETLGFRIADIERIEARGEQLELDELYLHNQARREGWLRRPRYAQELAALRDEALEALGHDEYDALRYARGEKNRVVVARLIPNSQAESIGLQAGDALLSYAGEWIHDPRSITEATAGGLAGELTELRIERDGEELRLFLPRGPIGVQLGRERRAPLRR